MARGIIAEGRSATDGNGRKFRYKGRTSNKVAAFGGLSGRSENTRFRPLHARGREGMPLSRLKCSHAFHAVSGNSP
jgi:hypothetical protein